MSECAYSRVFAPSAIEVRRCFAVGSVPKQRCEVTGSEFFSYRLNSCRGLPGSG